MSATVQTATTPGAPSAPLHVDRNDAPVRDRRAHHAHVKLRGEGDIGREQTTAEHQRRILKTRD